MMSRSACRYSGSGIPLKEPSSFIMRSNSGEKAGILQGRRLWLECKRELVCFSPGGTVYVKLALLGGLHERL